ncbi:MAG TPA: hypothetical protein VK907_06740, partial [Phnomibacter sp.]|nr:hypothetical protein [Phnomibacter sp.]
MMRKVFAFIVFPVVLYACGPAHFAPVQMNNYTYGMDAARQGEQTAMKQWLQPYADSVNNSMDLLLGKLEVPLTKSWPDCSLG